MRKNIKRRQGDWRHDQNAQRIAHFDKQMKVGLAESCELLDCPVLCSWPVVRAAQVHIVCLQEQERRLKAQQHVKKMLEDQLKINQDKQATMSDADKDKVLAHFKDIHTMIADAGKMEQVRLL